jgi:hypothetical protein
MKQDPRDPGTCYGCVYVHQSYERLKGGVLGKTQSFCNLEEAYIAERADVRPDWCPLDTKENHE